MRFCQDFVHMASLYYSSHLERKEPYGSRRSPKPLRMNTTNEAPNTEVRSCFLFQEVYSVRWLVSSLKVFWSGGRGPSFVKSSRCSGSACFLVQQSQYISQHDNEQANIYPFEMYPNQVKAQLCVMPSHLWTAIYVLRARLAK